MNITRQNPIVIKFTKLPITPNPAKDKIRVVGPPYLLGYHRLKFNRDHRTPKYITINEIDALIYGQLGLEVYCSMTDECDLQTHWHPLFKNLDVIIFTSYDQESLINTQEFAINNLSSIKTN